MEINLLSDRLQLANIHITLKYNILNIGKSATSDAFTDTFLNSFIIETHLLYFR